jgi:hypothetical protein
MNSDPASVGQPQAPATGSCSREASWMAALPDDFGALLRDGIDLHVHGQRTSLAGSPTAAPASMSPGSRKLTVCAAGC